MDKGDQNDPNKPLVSNSGADKKPSFWERASSALGALFGRKGGYQPLPQGQDQGYGSCRNNGLGKGSS